MTCVNGLGLRPRQADCMSICSNLLNGIASCHDVSCLCPTFSASATPCSICLQDSGQTSAINSIASFGFDELCASFATATPSALPASDCPDQCSDVFSGLANCLDNNCLCPIISASGSACSVCLQATGNLNYPFASVSSLIVTGCQNVPTVATPTEPSSAFGTSSTTSISGASTPSGPTSAPRTSQSSSAPTGANASTTQSKSGASGFIAGVFCVTGYIQTIMLCSLLAGVLSVLL